MDAPYLPSKTLAEKIYENILWRRVTLPETVPLLRHPPPVNSVESINLPNVWRKSSSVNPIRTLVAPLSSTPPPPSQRRGRSHSLTPFNILSSQRCQLTRTETRPEAWFSTFCPGRQDLRASTRTLGQSDYINSTLKWDLAQ